MKLLEDVWNENSISQQDTTTIAGEDLLNSFLILLCLCLANTLKALALTPNNEGDFNNRLCVALGFVKVGSRSAARSIKSPHIVPVGRKDGTCPHSDRPTSAHLPNPDRYAFIATEIHQNAAHRLSSQRSVSVLPFSSSLHQLSLSLPRTDPNGCPPEIQQQLLSTLQRS